MKILIINGPNLNLLGRREPEVYGNRSFEDYLPSLRERFNGHTVDYYQSNHEGALIDKLQEADGMYDGIVLNAASYSHTSVGIADAIAAIDPPVVEVHISNVHKRESFRHYSYLSALCAGSITGFGLLTYELAIRALVK